MQLKSDAAQPPRNVGFELKASNRPLAHGGSLLAWRGANQNFFQPMSILTKFQKHGDGEENGVEKAKNDTSEAEAEVIEI